ncbi:MAG TPA: universal stress protein [Dyella sp.]|uniref:universal stress protein n=1 Tax=Dyella sp. TaxID=1869338 RepID=UPI002BAF433A|nr:universal stress protein [Dyella sp.]HTV84634.1 universal stress protein [Dyella sp.]
MFKNILLPTDGSDQSLRAAQLGIAIAKQLGARVHAYHVLAPLAAIAYFSDSIRHSPEDYRSEAVSRAQRQLDAIEALAKEADVPFDGGYTFDKRPYAAIVGAARQFDCDLIVMGIHGHTGIDRLVMGGETNKVLSCSDIPVLVCR